MTSSSDNIIREVRPLRAISWRWEMPNPRQIPRGTDSGDFRRPRTGDKFQTSSRISRRCVLFARVRRKSLLIPRTRFPDGVSRDRFHRGSPIIMLYHVTVISREREREREGNDFFFFFSFVSRRNTSDGHAIIPCLLSRKWRYSVFRRRLYYFPIANVLP